MRFFWGWNKSGRYVATDKTTFCSLVEKLALCTGLRVLQLFDVPEVNFDDIAKSFPALEVLAVEYRRYKDNREWTGSLQGLCKLQQLSLINLGCHKRQQRDGDVEEKVVEMLPSGSVASLTHLQLIDDGADVTNTFAQSLHTFVNLTHLSLIHITNETVDLIVGAEFRLIDLKIKVWSGMNDKTESMRLLLSSPALHDLQSLELSFRGDVKWFSQRTYLITTDSIATHLTNLHHLKLRMPLYLSRCGQFNQLSNLKSIVWVTPMVIDVDRTLLLTIRRKQRDVLKVCLRRLKKSQVWISQSKTPTTMTSTILTLLRRVISMIHVRRLFRLSLARDELNKYSQFRVEYDTHIYL